MRLPAWISTPAGPTELSVEGVVIQIRWTGLGFGFLLANIWQEPGQPTLTLNLLLAVGLIYTLLDTWFFRFKQIFLGDYPLFISLMEAFFIGLLAYFHAVFSITNLLSIIRCASE